MSVGISLRLSGVSAFFAVIVIMATWAVVTLCIEGVIEDTWLVFILLIILYGVSIGCIVGLAAWDLSIRQYKVEYGDRSKGH